MKIRLRYRIAALTLSVLFLVAAAARYAVVNLATRYLWEDAEIDAVRLADTIAKATRHQMLSLVPGQVVEVVAGVSRQRDVTSLRLFDGTGAPKFTSHGVPRSLDLAGAECTSCHADPRTLPRAKEPCLHWRGSEIVVYQPFRNESSCSAVSCHPDPREQPLLGVLELKTDTSPIAAKVSKLRAQGLLWSVILLAVAGVPILVAFVFLVERPLAECLRLVREVSKNNLGVRSRVQPSNEWGELLRSFDSMVSAMQSARVVLEALNRDLEGQVSQRTRELEKALEAAQESDRMKTEFLANLSHEFSTPLQGVIGYSQLLLDGIDGEVSAAQRQDVERILRSGRRLLDWVEDLLELARLDGGRRFLCVDRIRIEDLAEEAAEAGAAAVAGKPVEIVYRAQPDCPQVWGEVAALRRVLCHVVENASRHTAQGKIEVTVEQTDPRWVDVRIEDTGPGMDPGILEAALKGFGSKTGGGGLSVGLSLVRRLMELHEGVFEISSKLGEGTKVRVRVPVGPPVELDKDDDARS